MHTPSLRSRVTGGGVAVVALVVVLLLVSVYVTLEQALERNLEEVLDARVELTRELAGRLEPDALATALQASGVPARITTADGTVRRSAPVPRFHGSAPALTDGTEDAVTRTLLLPAGATAEVFATRAGVEATLRDFLLLASSGAVVAVVVALLLFRRAAGAALAPLDHVVAAADRTGAGTLDLRLRPDDPDTELGRLATAYDDMLDRLEEALEETRSAQQRTRRFVDDAAHQLRTPLTSVRLAVETLLVGVDGDTREALFGHLVTETARATRLLNALLTLARLDQERPPRRVGIDLVRACREELERMASLAPHLAFEVRTGAGVGLPSDAGLEAAVDPEELVEALGNLLDNARRHAASQVVVTVAVHDDTAVLRVEDDGPGLAPADAEAAFERFQTLDGLGGTGLGLPIARAIANRHGGTLTYAGRGFELRLPVAAPAPT
ncbi:HAMP domain-containing sensor histidine kinase [Egicoccus halophilus]|uniref:histidine kinase n=1 Tax=Egicoccus halophilus TaxID=1670830 RepID=A0A8J3ERZ6_9ACTN|nr:HAMP domain-containing sensor histidine kinase [Egicoccus halophilus]GGI06099.1 two-component sensor histidine kinase [Egicoccus halophilus]